MSSIRHMAGSFIHAPERFDELAERIARTDRRIDEVIREDAVPYIRQYLDRASENRDWLEKMNHEMSIHPTVWGDPGRLEIDESAAVYTCLFNTNSGRIRIGRYTFAGSRVSVLAGSHDPELTGLLRRDAELTEGCDITIGNGVWLGSGSIVLGPCTIGDNAVIAAGAVVTPGTEVPANTVWGGVPARQISELKLAEEISLDAPAVRRAFDRSNGALYADGWSEKSFLFAEAPGHWLTDETGLVITDRAAWRIRFRKEGEGGCSLRIAGPEGEKTVALDGYEGQRVARLPVREGGRTMLRFSVSPAERIYIALVPAEASEAEEAEREETAGKERPAAESPAQPETAAAEAPAEKPAEEPAEKDPVALDIEKIMEEIREEVRKHGPYDDIPEFEGLPKAGSVSAKFLRGSIERLTADYVIPISQPDTGRNPVKKVYRKAAAKAVRCVTAPMAVKATDTNLALKTALINAAEVIEMQQKQIDDLAARISELEKDPVALDIEKIMEEIREEVRRHGPYDDIPEFEGLPKAGSVSAKFLRGSIERLTADYVIPVSQPDTGRNPVKKVYRKAAAKAVRCVTAPMAVKATDMNLALKTALINAAEVIEMQQKQIDDLAARISELEKKG